MILRNLTILLLGLFLISAQIPNQGAQKHSPKKPLKMVDKNATEETKALYYNLHKISETGLMVGHQDDLAYGVGWNETKGKSDVKDVCGSYPAVYGWDISKIGQSKYNIDSVRFSKMQKWIKEGYKRGGVITISWHMDNFKSGGDSWDKTPSVASILPGAELHGAYTEKLDLFAKFVEKLKVKGKHIPIIFRPFHEHTGSWFWWGKENCSKEEYLALWRFTVEYLRDTKDLHNILYAYSTDVFQSKEDYLDRYPGDDYIDILSYDDYHSIKGDSEVFTNRLKMLVELADEKGKVAALSETGVESVDIDNWFTNNLLNNIKSNPITQKIAWVLIWRNHTTKHHYMPYPGHPSADDFKKFKEDEFTIFEDDLPNMYQMDENN